LRPFIITRSGCAEHPATATNAFSCLGGSLFTLSLETTITGGHLTPCRQSQHYTNHLCHSITFIVNRFILVGVDILPHWEGSFFVKYHV
jgi:hypothetical protein